MKLHFSRFEVHSGDRIVLGQLPESRAQEVFRYRGYYITFMRMPTMGLTAWKQTVDCVQADGGNTLLLWMAGRSVRRSFPSPGTTIASTRMWKRIRSRIDRLRPHQKDQGVASLHPVAYDGVNQYPIEHPS